MVQGYFDMNFFFYNRILGDLPNTYAFTKSLGEALVVEKMDSLPVVVMRPSIVIPIYQDPIPGWTDNINGPTGLLIGAGKGVIRTMYCDSGESHNRGLNHVIILHQTISFPFSQTGMAITCQWTLR